MAIHAAFTIDTGEESKMAIGRYWTWANEAERISGKYTLEIAYSPLGSWRQYLSVENQQLPKDGETFQLAFRVGGEQTYQSGVQYGMYKAMSLTELRKTRPDTEPFDVTDGKSTISATNKSIRGIQAGRKPNNNIGKRAGSSTIITNVNPNMKSLDAATGLYATRVSGSGASRIFIYADSIAELGSTNNAAVITNAKEDGNTTVVNKVAAADPEAAKLANVNVPATTDDGTETTGRSNTGALLLGLGGAGAIGYALMVPAAPVNGMRRLNGKMSDGQLAALVIGVGLLGVAGYLYWSNSKDVET